jgi:hypothetical protein
LNISCPHPPAKVQNSEYSTTFGIGALTTSPAERDDVTGLRAARASILLKLLNHQSWKIADSLRRLSKRAVAL